MPILSELILPPLSELILPPAYEVPMSSSPQCPFFLCFPPSSPDPSSLTTACSSPHLPSLLQSSPCRTGNGGGEIDGGNDSYGKDKNITSKEAAEKNTAATAALADGGSNARPPPSATAVAKVIKNTSAMGSRLERSYDSANRQFDPEEKVIDGASAVLGLRDMIGEASTLLMRKGTWAGNVCATSVPREVMADTSADTVLRNAIRDAAHANAVTVLAIVSCDSRGVSSLENALGGSPFAVLGAGLSGAREESVLEYVVDDASAVLAWETQQSKLSGTRVFAVLVDMIDYASGNSLLGDVTWTGGSYGTYSVSMLGEARDVSAISVLGGVMIGMSAETVLGVEISDANADIGQENTEGDSRRASSPEDVTDIISRFSVLGTALDGASRLSVSGDVIINANSVFVWRNKHDGTRATTLPGDVTDCASGESALGNVIWTGGTSSVSVMGDLHDMSAITVLGGHVIADTSAATVLRFAISDANARARLKQRMSDDSRRVSRPENMIRSPVSAGAGLGGASGASVSADVIEGTSSALV